MKSPWVPRFQAIYGTSDRGAADSLDRNERPLWLGWWVRIQWERIWWNILGIYVYLYIIFIYIYIYKMCIYIYIQMYRHIFTDIYIYICIRWYLYIYIYCDIMGYMWMCWWCFTLPRGNTPFKGNLWEQFSWGELRRQIQVAMSYGRFTI